MRNPGRRTAALLFALLLTLGLSGQRVTLADAEVVAPASNDCSYDPQAWEAPETRWRRLSNRAELVAPTRLVGSDAVAPDATSAGRGRPSRPSKGQVQTFEARNFIDTEIFGKMQKDGIRWTVRSSDEEFQRRVYLDLTGTIPDVAATKAFLADKSADKRDKLIDQLLASDFFNDRWTMWLGDHLQVVQIASATTMQPAGRNAYTTFLKDSLAAKKPYDQLVRELIAGTGPQFTSGPANYWVRQIQNNGPIQDTYDNLSAFAGERFLGLPLVCLSCHNGIGHLELVNSGLSRRTRMEFWKNASFFSQTNTQRLAMGGELVVNENPNGAYRLNTTGGNKTARQPASGQPAVVDPAFFLSGETPRAGETRRQAFGRMITANPQFARATVNYLWQEIFGLGIVEPADSFDLLRQDAATLPPGATLQPTHPQLLTDLANAFVASGYDLRALLKLMVQSNAYQLSSRYTPGEWNELWTPYYARHYPRRIMAEALFDAISRATGVSLTLSINMGAAPGITTNRAMLLPDTLEGRPYATFLNNFGRGNRDDQKRTSDTSIVQALAMMNDRIVADRVKATANGSTVQKITRSTTVPDTIVDELYLATLSRYPTADERRAAIDLLRSGDQVRKSEDLQFVLLNRLEFLFN